jgi:hypothetical protein
MKIGIYLKEVVNWVCKNFVHLLTLWMITIVVSTISSVGCLSVDTKIIVLSMWFIFALWICIRIGERR